MQKRSFAHHKDFDDIVRLYKERYGIDLSHMGMKWSKHPVYNDGRRSYDFPDDEHGGSWVDDGTVRINPKMGPVMKRFGIEGMTQAEFRRRIIAHELAHEVWFKQARKEKVKRLIRDSLAKARKENFTTPYLDTYPADTPKRKFDSELFAEWMSDQLNKKAGYEYEDIDDESVARYKKGYRNVGRIRLLKTTRGVFVVKDGKLAGFISTERKDDGKTWVQALEVTPDFRRKGIARELLRKAVDDMGATDLTVRKTNEAARRLYDSEGWVPYKEEGIMEFRKKASDAKYSLKEDPTYEDALKVFDRLGFDDRANLVPRHPDFLRRVPDDMLFDRQVVVDGKGDPVGFQEFYSRKDKRGWRLPPHNIVAVAPEARGNGLARLMAEAAVKKARKEKIKRLVWEAFADNEPSIRAALSAGFEDATPKNAKTYRKLVYNVKKDSSVDR